MEVPGACSTAMRERVDARASTRWSIQESCFGVNRGTSSPSSADMVVDSRITTKDRADKKKVTAQALLRQASAISPNYNQHELFQLVSILRFDI